jgi:sugar/nucleoside kinase (ribokinase family)
MSQQNDVVVVGNVGIDTNVYFAGGQVDFSRDANFTENIDLIGQAGGYASRGYNQLGARTALIGHVGNDYSGEYIRDALEKDSIDIRALFTDPAGTSRSVNLIDGEGRRRAFYDGKSHMTLSAPREVCEQVFAGAKLAHFNIPNWARDLLPAARAAGLRIACDIQDVQDPNEPYRADFIRAADYLFFSAVNYPDPSPVIANFLQKNSSLVVVCGMGERGCALGTSAGIKFFPPAGLDLPLVDTNGAGDALAVGFLTSHALKGYPLEESTLRGQICARYKCSIKASSSRLITWEMLEHYRQLIG